MLLCALVWETLPHTTGTGVSPQQRWSRYCFPAAYQTADPHWDGPERDTTSRLNTKNAFLGKHFCFPTDLPYQVSTSLDIQSLFCKNV